MPTWSKAVRFGSWIAPLAVTGLWGASYFIDCFQTLAAPGVPAQFDYDTPSGKVRINASSYAFDLRAGVFTVSDLTVVEPKGARVAKAARVTLDGLQSLLTGSGVLRARVRDLDLEVARLENGQVELERLLPQSDGKSTPVPFEVSLQNTVVHLVNRGRTGSFREQGTAAQIQISGFGKDWIARGDVDFRSGSHFQGGIQAQVQGLDGQGVLISALVDRIEAASVARYLQDENRTAGQGREADAFSAQISGPLRVFVPAEGRPRWIGSGTAKLTGLNSQGFSAKTATFSGVVTPKGAVGRAEAATSQDSGRFEGQVRWEEAVEACGTIALSIKSAASLPASLRSKLPPKTAWENAAFEGYGQLRADRKLEIQGNLGAEVLAYGAEMARRVNARIGVYGDDLRADVDQVDYRGSLVSGWLNANLSNRQVRGLVHTNRIELGSLARQYGAPKMSGWAAVTALVSGEVSDPSVLFRADGKLSTDIDTLGALALNEAQAYGVLEHRQVRLARGFGAGPWGLALARGTVGLNGDLNLKIDGRGLQPDEFQPTMKGTAVVAMGLTGSLRKPKFQGRAEGYGLGFNGFSVTAATTLISGDRNRVSFSNLFGLRGTAQLRGTTTLVFKDKSLQGLLSLSGLQVSEWLGESGAGALDAPSIKLTGDLDNPEVSGQIFGSRVVLSGVKVDGLRANVVGSPRQIHIPSLEFIAADGTVTGAGAFDLSTEVGEFTLKSKKLDLDKLAVDIQETAELQGTTTLIGKVTIKDGEVGASASGVLDGIQVNRTPLGVGNWNADYKRDRINVNLAVGSVLPVHRQLDLNVEYDTRSSQMLGSADGLNLRLQTLLGTVMPYVERASGDALRIAQETGGDLSFAARFAGDADNPKLELRDFEAQNLTIEQIPFGVLGIKSLRGRSGAWILEGGRLKGEAGDVNLAGTYAERGAGNLALEATDFRLASLSPFVPALRAQTGIATLKLRASGDPTHPRVDGSLEVNRVWAVSQDGASASPSPDDLRIRIPKLELDPLTGVKLAGEFDVLGLHGSFDGAVGFDVRRGFADQPIVGHANLDARLLQDLAPLKPYIDPLRTVGQIGGRVELGGTTTKPVYSGAILLTAPKLGIQVPGTTLVSKVDDEFRNVQAALSFSSTGRINAGLEVLSARGGSLSFLAGLTDPLTFEKVDFKGLNYPISGRLDAKGFRFRQALGGGFVSGKLDTDLLIQGTLKRPDIAGSAGFSDLVSALPSFEPRDSVSNQPLINPTFRVDVNLKNSARIRSTSSELELGGRGSIFGSLDEPAAVADLTVLSGSLRLPGANIRVENGGKVNFAYQGGARSVSPASLDVEMRGRTSLVRTRLGEASRRYDVTLDITGDLFKSNDLKFNATSDPPDLSTDDVIALIGQKDLLDSLGSASGTQTGFQNKLQTALTGFALPAFLDPVTSNIAKGIGLDYLNVEYAGSQQTSFALAKTLSSEFSVQFRQQIGQPIPGYRSFYDLKFIYAPRRLPGAFRRFNFSVGADQDRPFKIAFEYSLRFGPGGQFTGPKKRTVLSPWRGDRP